MSMCVTIRDREQNKSKSFTVHDVPYTELYQQIKVLLEDLYETKVKQ